jgi:hypothetical protein
MAAGLATLRSLRDEPPYERLEALSARLADGLDRAATDAGVPHVVQRVGSMLTLFFHDGPVHNYEDAKLSDTSRPEIRLGSEATRPKMTPVVEMGSFGVSNDEDAASRVLVPGLPLRAGRLGASDYTRSRTERLRANHSLPWTGTRMVASSPATDNRRVLFMLVAANVVASVLHYVDNVIFFKHYPEPTWLNPHLVDMAWFIMTPFGLAGCLLFLQGRRTAAFACLYLFSLMNLLVLGHYLIAPPWKVSFKINLFIMLEAVGALILGAYTAWLQFQGSRSLPQQAVAQRT